jgi:hypothetical protein
MNGSNGKVILIGRVNPGMPMIAPIGPKVKPRNDPRHTL